MDTAIAPATFPAPEFPPSLEWLNLSAPLQMATLYPLE